MVCEFYLKLLEKKMKYRKNNQKLKSSAAYWWVEKVWKSENWNVEERMSGERHFTEYLCSHGNFSYIRKKGNMNQDVQGSLK